MISTNLHPAFYSVISANHYKPSAGDSLE